MALKLARLVDWLAARAGDDTAARLDAAEIGSGRVARYQLYDAELLEADLRRYEERFGLATSDMLALYEQDDLPPGLPRHIANTWVGVSREVARVRDAPPRIAFLDDEVSTAG